MLEMFVLDVNLVCEMSLSSTRLNETKDLPSGPWRHRAFLCYQLSHEKQAGAQSTQANVPLSGMSISSTCERRTSALIAGQPHRTQPFRSDRCGDA